MKSEMGVQGFLVTPFSDATPNARCMALTVNFFGNEDGGAVLRGGGLKNVAIIGLSGRFPGAQNISEFWRNLSEGKESISMLSDEELRRFGVSDDLLSRPEYVKAAPILDGIDRFDADFFNISKQEAELMDPQQRILLECAWEAFESSGYSPIELDASVGVYASAGGSVIGYLLECFEAMPELRGTTTSLAHTGTDKDFLTTRISYKLNLKGPSVAVQTACSSSLVAVHMACQSLQSGECEMALAGGINIRIPHISGYLKQEDDVLSSDGHCRAFDASASGTVFGSGVGLVLLKPLEHAVRDKDKIFAVIKGTAINNDGGKKLSYSAASVQGQVRCIELALKSANVHPESIGYVEAHGAGTIAGDPIEVLALTTAYRRWTDRKQFCRLGSVKTNIGHMDTAAGIAGLIKATLALHHRQVPAHLNYRTANPKLNLGESPFRIESQSHVWDSDTGPRRAAVNSLGIGGTNSHVILEEAPAFAKRDVSHDLQGKTELYVVSARTDVALRELVDQHLQFLEAQGETFSVSLRDLCANTCIGRTHFEHRLVVLANSIPELRQKLVRVQKGESDPAVFRSRLSRVKNARLSADEILAIQTDQRMDTLRYVVDHYISGGSVDWSAIGYENGAYEKVDLPFYPFQRRRYWVGDGPSLEWKFSEDFDLFSAFRKLNDRAIRESLLVEFLKSEASKVLSKNTVDTETSLMELGLDSLMVVEFRNGIKKAIGGAKGKGLPSSVVFSYPSIKALSGFLYSYLGETKSEVHGLPSNQTAMPSTDAIAIVSMGCRFPGGADTPELFWELLESGRSSIGAIPKTRFDIEKHFHADASKPGKTYVRHGGFLEGIDRFDAHFFGVSPREAMALDPQQRLLLEVCWEALERQGDSFNRIFHSKTGVFIGAMYQDYADRLAHSSAREHVEMYLQTGAAASSLAGRLSYFFNFTGPAISLDTACSSSLSALHLACESLRNGSCDRAVVGGVNAILSPVGYISMSRARAFSFQGRCSTFDAAADGYVRSEGCGVLILRRLSEAQKDGDPILAVIRGTAVNQDGRSASFTAPNGRSQITVIQEALQIAGVAPDEVGYVEAHGTGTPLGDPIELHALGEVFRDRKTPLVVGSVKTNIGHTEAAAGVAGVIKTILSMQNEKIPKHLHFRELNPEIDIDPEIVQIPVESRRWDRSVQRRRIAGISSFGISGTNAHVVLEEPPIASEVTAEAATFSQEYDALLPLSAKSEAALAELARKYIARLEQATDVSLKDICASASVGRAHFECRLVVLARSVEELREKLTGFLAGGLKQADLLLDLSSDKAASSQVQSLQELAKQYLAGEQIDWEKYVGSYRRVGIPTYAFDRQTYWIENEENRNPIEGNGHPLLGKWVQDSTRETEYIFEREFGLSLQPFFGGHKVFDKVVVPGAAYLEMALAAGREILGEAIGVDNVSVENISIDAPMVLEINENRLVQLVLSKNLDAGSFKILSRATGRADVWTVHATGRLASLSSDGLSKMKAEETHDLVSLRARCEKVICADDFYRNLTAMGFAYSGKYNGVREAWFSATEVVSHIGLPMSVADEILSVDSSYVFHPALLDSCLHAGFAALERTREYLLMPVGVGRYANYRKVEGPIWSHVNYRSNSENQMTVDVRVMDEWGLVAEIQGLVLREATPTAFEKALGHRQETNVSDYIVSWRKKDNYSTQQVATLKRQTWIILSDRLGLGVALAEEVRNRGGSVTLLFDDLDAGRRDHAIRDVLKESSGKSLQVVHLWSLDSPAVGSALSLLKLLNGTGHRPHVTFVTNQAQFVGASQKHVNFRQCGLLGLVRVSNHEAPNIESLLIDVEVSHDDLSECVQQIIGEIRIETEVEGERDREVAYRQGNRYVPRLIERAVNDVSSPQATAPLVRFSEESSYLVTGGLGGIGFEVARFLVNQGARNLILLGRSRGLAFDQSPAREKVDELSEMGARVHFFQADVSSKDDIVKVFSQIHRDSTIPPLKGIVHCAGLYQASPLMRQTELDFETLSAVKLGGAWNLYEATKHGDLDFFSLFSSSSSVLGYTGLAGYAAANAELDGLSHHLRQVGIPAQSINWGPWSEVGMLKRLTHVQRDELRREGLISPDQGLKVFDRLLRSRSHLAQAVVLSMDWENYLATLPASVNRAFCSEIKISDTFKHAPSSSFVRGLQKATKKEDQERLLVELLTSLVRGVLGYEAAQNANLISLGMDSLMAVDMRNRLKESLGEEIGREIPAVLVFNYPSIELMKGYLMSSGVLNKLLRANDQEPRAAVTFEIEDEQALSWATDVANSTDPRAVKILAAMVEKLRRQPTHDV